MGGAQELTWASSNVGRTPLSVVGIRPGKTDMNTRAEVALAAAIEGAPHFEFPEKLCPLMEGYDGTDVVRRRYYVAYGGRGGARSWSFARALILQAMRDPLLILCAREIMNSIAESVHRLLSNQIELMGLSQWFTVQDTSITCKATGAEFIFVGLRTVDVTKVKSYEGVDIVWVEEAERVSKTSWNTLTITIRAPGSEIWVTFNPNMDTDETYKRFVVDPPESAWVQKVTWQDNPWFPEVLEADRKKMQRQDPDEYDNVWNGNPRTVVAGAIYAKEVVKMIEDRRFRPVPYDPRLLVHTIWDLGWNDQTSIIFAQRLHSEVRVIDYEEESFLRPDEWAKRIKDKTYVYGSHNLPHDGAHERLEAKGISLQEQLKTLLGMKPKIIERCKSVEDPIRAARMMWPRVYMDEVKCARLMECLKHFRRGVPESTGEPGAPVKDEYRHGADAYGGMAMIVDQLSNEGGGSKTYPLADSTPLDRGMGM